MRPSAPKLLRLHMSFSQPKQAAAKQQHKIKDKNGVTRIYSKELHYIIITMILYYKHIIIMLLAIKSS